jgi:predicted ABC-type transport system involved in lysophospholipase L1 biosynthesis ATPase subunit
LLEEPWQGMDQSFKQQLIGFLLDKSRKSTLLLVSNDEDFAAKCDFRLYLENGNAKLIRNK